MCKLGYGAVSMDLLRRILSYGQCEVFTYLSYKEMNRWITDDHKWPAFTRAYGGEEWRACLEVPERERQTRLLELYKAAIRNRAGAKYVTSFLMFDKNDQPLYWLLFCTNNLVGLEVMKKAMWHVDKTGGFRFSDGDNPHQLSLLEEAFDQTWLAGELSSKLAGRTMSLPDVIEYVLTETPCYLWKGALKQLETKNKTASVQGPADRKPGTYPDHLVDNINVRFAQGLPGF